MEIKSHFNHFNINVSDLQKSITFYKEALGLEPVGEIRPENGEYVIVYLSRPGENFRLELTWLRDHRGVYELGENESHLAMKIDNDFMEALEFHRSKGWVCLENIPKGYYFINDPDDYWIEILANNKKMAWEESSPLTDI
jgi:lactoylglutathione lyase